MKWINVKDGLPRNGQVVFVAWKYDFNGTKRERFSHAEYIAPKSSYVEENYDDFSGGLDEYSTDGYDPERDMHWMKDGFYEFGWELEESRRLDQSSIIAWGVPDFPEMEIEK